MFSICNSITNNVFKENLEDTTGFFINQTRDTLDTTTTSKTTNSRLGNTLNIITKNLSMTLGTTLSETFTTFSTTSHFYVLLFNLIK